MIRRHIILSIVLSHSFAMAEEVPEHFTPVRPAGMGGAFTAVANDENSIWTNPAGISRSRKARSRETFSLVRIPNLIVGANSGGRGFYDAFQNSKDKSIETLVNTAEDLSGKPLWARAAAFPVALFDVARDQPMAFGVYTNNTLKAVIQKETPEEARVEMISDLGSTITIASSALGNRLNIGLQLRPVLRYAYEDRIPSAELLNRDALKNRISDDSNKGQGLGIDVGMIYTLADFWYPTIGFAVQNLPTGCRKNYLNPFTEKPDTVCGNVYRGNFGNEDALSVVDPTDIRLGVAITPRFNRKLAMRFALDAHHLAIPAGGQTLGLTGIEASKLIHGGVELFVGNPLEISPFSVRAGYSQGFASFGASLNMGLMQLDFASYGRDVSSSASAVEDRRMLASLSFDF